MVTTEAMRERPILFSGEMVNAILDGRKTQTRRVVKLPSRTNPLGEWKPATLGGPGGGRAGNEVPAAPVLYHTRTGEALGCPYGRPGDRLWVRETWGWFPEIIYSGTVGKEADRCFWRRNPTYAAGTDPQSRQGAGYRANGQDLMLPPSGGWRPSIHMPRWASRLTLEITDVRVERLQDISAADAEDEGCPGFLSGPLPGDDPFCAGYGPRTWFRKLWDATMHAKGGTHDAHGWLSNPWVWAISFRRLEV